MHNLPNEIINYISEFLNIRVCNNFKSANKKIFKIINANPKRNFQNSIPKHLPKRLEIEKFYSGKLYFNLWDTRQQISVFTQESCSHHHYWYERIEIFNGLIKHSYLTDVNSNSQLYFCQNYAKDGAYIHHPYRDMLLLKSYDALFKK
jgi:hypothetical protein